MTIKCRILNAGDWALSLVLALATTGCQTERVGTNSQADENEQSIAALSSGDSATWAPGSSVRVCFATRPLRGTNEQGQQINICQRQQENTDCFGETWDEQSSPKPIKSAPFGPNAFLSLNADGKPIAANDSQGTVALWRWIKVTDNQGGLMFGRGATGNCLSVGGNGSDNGSKVEMKPCEPNDGKALDSRQIWEPLANGTLKNPASAKCLDVPNASLDTQVIIYDCDQSGRSNQQWTTPPLSGAIGWLKSALKTRYCLSIASGSSGDMPVVTFCGGSPKLWRWTKWDSQKDLGAIRAEAGGDNDPGHCLQVAPPGTGNKRKVILGECNWQDTAEIPKNQQFVRQADGSLKNPESGLCLDVPAWSIDTQLEMFECNGGTNQQWETKNPEDGILFNKDDLHKQVRSAIENSYNRMAGINLWGWDDCPKTDGNVHDPAKLAGWLYVSFRHDGGAGHVHLKKESDHAHTSLVYENALNWRNLAQNHDVAEPIHEFGHNMGFGHETHRVDWPYRVCAAGMVDHGNKFNTSVRGTSGEYYCIQSTSSDSLKLANCDSGGDGFNWIRRGDYPGDEYYGGALKLDKGGVNKCITVSGNGKENGTKAKLATCDSQSEGQLWVPELYGSLRNPNSKKCLDVPASDLNAELAIWDCKGESNQRWNSIAGKTWGTLPDPNSLWDYCVPETGNLTTKLHETAYCLQLGANNIPVVADCGGVYDVSWRWEKWDILEYTGTNDVHEKVKGGALMAYKGDAATNRCLEVVGAGRENGTLVQMATCNGSDGQLWEPSENDSLRNSNAGKCLDVPGSARDAQLIIHDCNGEANQKWSLEAIKHSTKPVPLSSWDIVGIHNAYGRKRAGSIVGLHGRCVGIPSPYTGPGQVLQMFNCDGRTDEEWAMDSNGHLYGTQHGTSAYWDVLGGALENEMPVGIYGRRDPATANQQWRFKNVAIRAIGDSCVGVPQGSFHDGASTEIQQCTRQRDQQWQVVPTGMFDGETTVAIKHDDYCWDVPRGEASQGQAIQVYGCHNGSNQRFTLTGKGEIRFIADQSHQWCVDVTGGTPLLGQSLELYPCKTDSEANPENQRFYLRGPIEVGEGSGKCLDLPPGDSREGAPVQIYSCNGGANQEWDYHFPPKVHCQYALDCYDGNPCVYTSCNDNGYCSRPDRAAGTACTNDGDPCTNDICSGGMCTHKNICGKRTFTPCSDFCANPEGFTWTETYQSGNLGTGEICRETTRAWVGGNCGNLSNGRALYLNGTPMSCNGQNWASLPPSINGGYCVQTTPGDYSWAYFTAW